MLSIKQGKIIIYRLFDVADEINLSLVEAKIKEGARRMRLTRYPSVKALEFANPPVSFELQGFTKRLFDQDIMVQVIAKAFDFGVISLSFNVAVPDNTTFAGLESVSKALDIDESIDEKAMEYVRQLVSSLDDAVTQSSIKEDYTLYGDSGAGNGRKNPCPGLSLQV